MVKNISRMSLIRKIRSFIFMILILLLIIFSVSIITDRLIFFFDTKDRIYTDTLDRQSELIKTEILTLSDVIYHYIDHNHDRTEALDLLSEIRFGENKDGFIFVVTYDGTTILNDPQQELVGINNWNLEDPNGVKIVQEQRKAAETPNGDFVYYSWGQPSTGKVIPKVSFIKGIPEWEWMVGTGVYLDSIEKESSIEKMRIYRSLFIRLFVLLVLIAVIFLYIYLHFRKFSVSVSNDIAIINNNIVGKELSREKFLSLGLKYDEFFIIASHINKTIISHNKAEKERLYSEHRLRLQREQSSLAYVEWDSNNRIIEWNPAAENLFGYSREEALGKSYTFIIPDSETVDVKNIFRSFKKNGNSIKCINKNRTKEGRIITCEWHNNNLIDTDGHSLGVVATALDITSRIKFQNEISLKNRELEKSLKEKNVLIKEVHHRVKNNMAIISSLLSLQSYSIEDEKIQTIIQSSQNRIQSMAMVHEHIYRNENIHDINIGRYITELIEYLMFSFGFTSNHTTLKIDIPDIHLELDTLISLGMLINEIVSNSLKYAYNNEIQLELSVILQNFDNNKFYLYIADNGTGFSFDNTSAGEGCIGLMLIRGLVDQIDGRLKITTEGKTAYEIYF